MKKALLFWDSIATIVPKSVDLAAIPDPEFHALMSAGVLDPWAVSSEVRVEVADASLALIDDGVHEQFPDGDPLDVNFGKLTHSLRDGLAKRDLVVRTTETDLTLHRNVALMVLTLLAHRLAEVTHAQPLTDDVDLGSCYLHVGYGRNKATTTLHVLERDLELAIPDLRDIELKKWLKYRDKNRSALELYRVGLRQLARDVSHASDPEEAEEILNDRRDRLNSTIDDRRGMFKTLTTADVTWTTLRVLFEVGTAPINPVIASALVGLEGAALLAGKFRRKELHSLSFVQEAAKKFG